MPDAQTVFVPRPLRHPDLSRIAGSIHVESKSLRLTPGWLTTAGRRRYAWVNAYPAFSAPSVRDHGQADDHRVRQAFGRVRLYGQQVVDHAEKLQGFQDEAARRDLAIAAVYEHQDDAKLGYELTRRMFRDHPDVRSVYVATDNFGGIFRALKEHGAAGRLKAVATGLFPEVRAAMEQDLVHFSLDQRMAEQGELAVQHLHDLLSGHPLETPKILVPPLIAVRSNIGLLATRLPGPRRPAGGR